MKKPYLYAASIIYTVVLFPPTSRRNPPLTVAAAAPQTPDILRYASPWRFMCSSCHSWLFKSESIPAKPCRHRNPCWFARCRCPQWKLKPPLHSPLMFLHRVRCRCFHFFKTQCLPKRWSSWDPLPTALCTKRRCTSHGVTPCYYVRRCDTWRAFFLSKWLADLSLSLAVLSFSASKEIN